MELMRLERVLRLIVLLINNRRTTASLAELLDCDLRSVQRYIELLKSAGFIVEYHSRGVPFLNKTKGRLKDISNLAHFSEEEGFILHKAIDSIDGNTHLKQNLKKKLYSIYNFPELADITVKPELGNSVQSLLEAISMQQCVKLEQYRSANSNSVSTREVEPYQFTTNYQQIWCYEPASKQCKLFTLTRIGKVIILDRNWQNKSFHLAAGVDVFRNSGLVPVGKVVFHLNIRAMSLLSEEYPLAEKHLTLIDDMNARFETDVYNFEGPARFVLGLFDNVTVLGDPAFSRFVDEKIISMQKKQRR